MPRPDRTRTGRRAELLTLAVLALTSCSGARPDAVGHPPADPGVTSTTTPRALPSPATVHDGPNVEGAADADGAAAADLHAPTDGGPLLRAPTDGGPLLRAAAGGDGDSWKDAAGRAYRLGLVNTPEIGGARAECFGAEASQERKRLTAGGFRAQVYTVDRYDRAVSVVLLPDGTNLNVELARRGYADDRYLAQFRSENPALAAQLDTAFASARHERAGMWGTCR